MPRNSCSIWHAEESRSTCAIASHKHSTSKPADWQSADSRSSFTLTKIQDSMKGDRRRRQSPLRVGGGPFSVILVNLDVRIVVCTSRTRTLPDTSDVGQKDCQEACSWKREFHLLEVLLHYAQPPLLHRRHSHFLNGIHFTFGLANFLLSSLNLPVQYSLILLSYTAKCPQVVSAGVRRKSKTSSTAKLRSQ
jgi:hypothetical protein